MTNDEARQFAFDSYITTFESGNEHMIDKYFDTNLEMNNHSVDKKYNLEEIKASVIKFHRKYHNLKSEVKDILVQGNQIAFRVEHSAFFVPEEQQVTMSVMNLYKVKNGKVKEWRLWFCQHPSAI